MDKLEKYLVQLEKKIDDLSLKYISEKNQVQMEKIKSERLAYVIVHKELEELLKK